MILLSAEQERALSKTILAGHRAAAKIANHQLMTPRTHHANLKRVEEGKQAAETLAMHNLRLVIAIAKWYIGGGLPLMDLIQEGNLGLLHGVRKYDWRKKCRASTYLSWWIRQAISRALIEQGRSIRLPEYTVKDVRRLQQNRQALYEMLGREPTTLELAQTLGEEVAWVVAHESLPKVDVWFGQTNEGEEETSEGILSTLPAPDTVSESLEANQRAGSLYAVLLKLLNPREFALVTQFFGLFGIPKLTLNQLALQTKQQKQKGREHITGERVRQIIAEALSKIRETAARDPTIAKMLDV